MNRLFVLSLDGVPFTLLQQKISGGEMPNLKALAAKDNLRQMDSVLPPVSSAAWTSFMTGLHPAYHGIWGFLERDPALLQWFIPNASHIRGDILWDVLSRHGKRCFVMNVPVSAPPRPINGIVIGGFPADNLSDSVFPPETGKVLKARGYRIDADVELAKTNPDAFILHLNDVLTQRTQIMKHYFMQENWDFFMVHIMETDRLHHFFWEHWLNGHPRFAPAFNEFYRRIDELIGEVSQACDDDTALMLLSDHGFATLKKEVHLNVFLQQKGLLKLTQPPGGRLDAMKPESIAYSVYPGRIYINLRGREKHGTVRPGQEFENACRMVRDAMAELTDPDDNSPVVSRVLTKAELLSENTDSNKIVSAGINNLSGIPLEYLPDLMALPHQGYDLKGDMDGGQLFTKTVFNGVHTQNDAFILGRGIVLPEDRFSIDRAFSAILSFFGVNKSGVVL